MARAAILALIGNDSEVTTTLEIAIPEVWSSNATDTPNPNKPFITINIADEPKQFPGSTVKEYEIWCHVPRALARDYGKIDAALSRIVEIMTSATNVHGADGWTMSSASHIGTSGDLQDDGYDSLCRRSSYRVASRYTGITP